MSIKSDIAEVRDLWSNATVLTRTVLILSLFLTISSVTSIADVVFEWRGFIRTAIDFYRFAIRDPIAYLLGFIWIPANVTDLIIAGAVAFGVVLRSSEGHPISRRHLLLNLLLIFPLGLLGIAALQAFVPLAYQPFGWLTLLFLLAGSILGISRRERLRYFTYVFVVYLVLFVLAAVNEGLTRPGGGP